MVQILELSELRRCQQPDRGPGSGGSGLDLYLRASKQMITERLVQARHNAQNFYSRDLS